MLPLALLPALAWPVGQAASGDLAWSPQALAASFVTTLASSLATVLLLAAAFYLLAPFFDASRHWSRSVGVAAYAATPVLAAGALLVLPVLIVACVVACLHAFALCYLGVQQMLGCRESDAAFFVAAACMAALVLSMLLAGLCGAVGLL